MEKTTRRGFFQSLSIIGGAGAVGAILGRTRRMYRYAHGVGGSCRFPSRPSIQDVPSRWQQIKLTQ